MNYKPILFSTEMVKAILNKSKTQTRRVIKMRDGSLATDEDISTNQNGEFDKVMDFTKSYPYWEELKPKANIGDVFWIRETFQDTDFLGLSPDEFSYIYKASENGIEWAKNTENWKWKSPIFMPKTACRIFLEVTNLRVEKVCEISELDSIKEGIPNGAYAVSAQYSFERLWKSINGEKSWNDNVWVWVYDFKMIDRPITFNAVNFKLRLK